jgi:hypothetical protein
MWLVFQVRAVALTLQPSPTGERLLEVEPNLSGERTRRDIVRAAEGGEKIVQRHLVRQVNRRQPQAPLVVLTAEEVVVPHAEIKKVSRRNPLRIVIVIFFPGAGILT